MSETSTVFVGKKPVMNYVLACLTLFQDDEDNVITKARGRAISKAVDVAPIMTKRFATDIDVRKIDINTERVKRAETGAVGNVSFLEISLGR